MFERFTDRARRVLVLAQEEARLLNHGYIGTEHILLGLIHEDDGVASGALKQLGISLESVRERVEETVGLSGSQPIGSPPFTPRAKKVLELSLREALQFGHNYIGTEHILLGLAREGEGVAAHVLAGLGADPDRVRKTVIALLGVEAVAPLGPTGKLSGSVKSTLVACSFCGRQPPDTGQLVSGGEAFICEHCVRHWHDLIETSPSPKGQSGIADPHAARSLFPRVEPTGPPPADEDAARDQISVAFAECDRPSDDGRSLPNVERGERLGPFALETREQHKGVLGEGAEITPVVEQVVFIDQTHGSVWFSISVDGRPVFRGYRGEAVLIEGKWKMARSTFSELMSLAGVDCPPD